MIRTISILTGRQEPERPTPKSIRQPAPPAWALELAEADPQHFSLHTVCISNSSALSPEELERESFAAYESLAQRVAKSSHPQAVRFWNHIPAINDPADAGRDIYMVFNAGRYRAFSDLLGGPGRFERDAATASAIGTLGHDLLIHCLASDAKGAAINNPRQVAPYHYSQRFGPLPPCFSRATLLSHPARLLLVSGTASVRGEDSVHLDDLQAQCNETFVNLAALISAAAGMKLPARPKLSRWLAAYRELRVYHPVANDADAIERAIRDAFPRLERLEMLHADLCRAELQVEIEGIADMSEIKSEA